MSACPASLHAAVPRAPRRAPRARALRCRAGPAGGGADGRASVWSLEQRKALEAKKDDELSKAPEPARPPPPASVDAVDAKMSRRQVGLSASVGLSALLGADVVFPSDAEAKKIISGYTPADGSFTCTFATHTTGDVGFDAWYDTAFAPAMKDLHTGELGGPKFGKAFATTFALGVLRGKEKADERVGTYFVHPTSEAKAFQAFFTDTGPKANPFWQTGRDAGWLTGEITTWQSAPFLFRGADPKTGFPPDAKKGQGLGVYAFGSKLDVRKDWIPAFTSPDSDKLHDANGVIVSAAGDITKGSDFASKYKGVQVYHFHKNFKQAKAFAAAFEAADAPPFDQISEILDNPKSFVFEVVKEDNFPEYLPQA